MLACCFGIMGALMLTIVIMRRNMKDVEKEENRQEELVKKYEEGTISSEEAAELARNPPIRPDQTIEAEINRYGPDFRPRAEELVEEFRQKKIDYKTFITELNRVRDMALKAKQYEV